MAYNEEIFGSRSERDTRYHDLQLEGKRGVIKRTDVSEEKDALGHHKTAWVVAWPVQQ